MEQKLKQHAFGESDQLYGMSIAIFKIVPSFIRVR